MSGYNPYFLGPSFTVELPLLEAYQGDIALNMQTQSDRLPYTYFTVVQSRTRRVPIVSASNIYRVKFEKVTRSGSFKKDDRLEKGTQLTTKEYREFNSIKRATIEKGHMTKREDVQWDINGEEKKAQEAARSTFFYPNSAPQHDKLNNGPWKHLENSIIIKGRVPSPAKVSVFTGPVLDKLDPEFRVALADGTPFQIPILFWKVIYYTKSDDTLYYAGFLMGQLELLRRDKLIKEERVKAFDQGKRRTSLKPFLEFKDNENYQVPVSLIEELTKLKFTSAIDRHADLEASLLRLTNVQIKSFDRHQSSLAISRVVEGLIA